MAEEDPKPDPGNIMPAEPEPTPEPGTEPEPDPSPEPATEKTYAELGLDERYDGMNREQMVADIKHRNIVHGRQAGEVGDLRKKLAAAQEKVDSFNKVAGQPVAVKEAVKKMSEGEVSLFIQDFQIDPDKAIRGLLGDNFGRRSDGDLKKMVGELFEDMIGQYQGYTEDQAVQTDPDYQVHANYMEGLRQPEHFGNTRPAQELMAFSKLANISGADKPTVDNLYDCMKRFPQVPMKDCLSMVKGRGGTKTVDPDKIRKQVDGLEGGTPPGSKKASSSEKITTMDEAFGDE